MDERQLQQEVAMRLFVKRCDTSEATSAEEIAQDCWRMAEIFTGLMDDKEALS